MIICRTPLRISFFGGGTDFPDWFKDNEGLVISTSIDKYIYITVRELPPFFDHNYRITYSKVEHKVKLSDIEHPAIKSILEQYGESKFYEIHCDADLPANSGLGSSSSFVVGLINALLNYNLKFAKPNDLVEKAIFIERDVLQENVGFQDQIAAAFGGLNEIVFDDRGYNLKPIILNRKYKESLFNNFLLFFTGFSRFSSDINSFQNNLDSNQKSQLRNILGITKEAKKILLAQNINQIDDFGILLNESWKLKKSLSNKISNQYIDEIYSEGIKSGAMGGKILGAGGGGFILFYAPVDKHEQIKNKFKKLTNVPFNFEDDGSRVIYSS